MDNTAISWREYIRQNRRLALPLMIGQLATIGILTSNTLAMGWIDSSSLAAQGIDAGDELQVLDAFRQGMAIAIALGLVTAPLLLFGEQVLVLLG